LATAYVHFRQPALQYEVENPDFEPGMQRFRIRATSSFEMAGTFQGEPADSAFKRLKNQLTSWLPSML